MGWSKGMFVLLTLSGLLPSNALSSRNGEAGLPQVCGLNLADCGRRRIVRDPATGMRWIVQRDGRHPGWPAKLVRISDEAGDFQSSVSGGKLGPKEKIVREGDVLAISDETATFQAVLEGVALSSGVPGDVINVRLRFAGKIIQARVMSQGKARLARDVTEGQK